VIGTTRFRAVVGFAVAAATLVAPAAARACNQPYISLSATNVAPGDTVYWSIANADIGAEWDGVRIAGRTVVPPGTVTEARPDGSFVVPDFGDKAISLPVETTLAHASDGGSWPKSATLEYRPPSPPPAEAPPEAGPPAESGAPPPVEELPGRRGEPNGNASPGGHTPGGGDTGDAPRGGNPQPREPVSTRKLAERAAPVGTSDEPSVFAPVQADARGVTATPNDHSPARPRPAHAPLPDRIAPVPQLEPRAVPVRPPTDSEGPPLLPLIVGAAAICGLVVLLRLRRRGQATGSVSLDPISPIPPDALIEAELQELVAEERHKRLQEEHGPEPAEAGEPIRAGPI
jgi:hypothetical protein